MEKSHKVDIALISPFTYKRILASCSVKSLEVVSTFEGNILSSNLVVTFKNRTILTTKNLVEAVNAYNNAD